MGIKNHTSIFYVANSGIHGKGLFASSFISKNTLIGTIKFKPTQQDGPYSLWSQDMQECVEVTCDLKYINHSNIPNVAYYDDNTVVAIQDIQPHTEMTHHYGADNAFINNKI